MQIRSVFGIYVFCELKINVPSLLQGTRLWEKHKTGSLQRRIIHFRLLYSVLPISVATELRHKRPVPPKRFECVTLLFSGIVGFSNYCAGHADSKGAMKIVRMLNQLYTAFDVLTDPKKNPNVYKVSIWQQYDMRKFDREKNDR